MERTILMMDVQRKGKIFNGVWTKMIQHHQPVQKQILALDCKIQNNIAVTEDEYDFLVQHGNYPQARRPLFCNQQALDTLAQFGGATDLGTLEANTIAKWIVEISKNSPSAHRNR